jgi:2-oxoglutarate ferredoxin oxidoreductase subunit beta
MRYPQFPEPIGVFRAVERPIYDEQINQQVEQAIGERGPGSLNKLFSSGDTWTVS